MRLVAMLASIALQGLSAVAGEKSIIPDQHSGPSEKTVPDWSFDVNSNYVFGSHFAYHRDYGSQSALNSEIKVGRRFRLWDTWYARFGFDLERFEFFKAVDVFPESLNSVALVAALEYWHGEDVGFYLELSPGVYFSKKITTNAFDIPIVLGTGYKITDHFFLGFGITTGLLREEQVLPIGGIIWNVSDKLGVKAIFPQAKITYDVNKALEFFIGGEELGGGYRTDSSKDRRTNKAVLNYSDIQAGGGFSVTPKRGVSFELSAGWSFRRDLDYFHAGPDVHSRGSPYIKADLSIDLY
jgi:hypothetical protein